jgi:hypothetical protein
VAAVALMRGCGIPGYAGSCRSLSWLTLEASRTVPTPAGPPHFSACSQCAQRWRPCWRPCCSANAGVMSPLRRMLVRCLALWPLDPPPVLRVLDVHDCRVSPLLPALATAVALISLSVCSCVLKWVLLRRTRCGCGITQGHIVIVSTVLLLLD